MSYLKILELLRDKDKKGLEALYLLYADKFFGYAVSKWHFSEDEAMNVVYQLLDTLVLKAFHYEFESQKHFDNFVFKVFMNFLRQEFRKSKKRAEEISFISLSDLELEEGSEKLNAFFSPKAIKTYYESDNIENPRLFALENALDKLDKLDKEILLLKAQNFTYDEIANMLGIENNQLKVKHHRAKSKLLKILEQQI